MVSRLERIQATASVVTAVGVVLGLAMTLYFFVDNNRTKLEITVGENVVSIKSSEVYNLVAITVVNHSKFPTTIRSVNIKHSDGSLTPITGSAQGSWAPPSVEPPTRIESRDRIVGLVAKDRFEESAVQVIATTVDGHRTILDVAPR